MNAYELAYKLNNALGVDYEMLEQSSIMLRQQADRIAELEKILEQEGIGIGSDLLNGGIAIVKKIQTKPLIDEVLNKAFDYYCETDEGVLRFDFDLRTEWKQKQLQRWKEAFRKAWD